MPGTPTKYRYPGPPPGLSEDVKRQWNELTRMLEQRDRDFLYGDDRTIQAEQLKDGVIGKGFTTVASSPFYLKQNSGTVLCDTSVSALDVYLTSAINSYRILLDTFVCNL